ncbi:MAG TPA: hypothetical protein VFC44_04175 [Candidatus Saccharimonadales bacterium]|nr:hypothetical protein [Candidatus Saccharimonadales bacterium]
MPNHAEFYADFQITSVCRADLESIGFDTAAVDDATMKELAENLANDYCNQLFWGSLEILADDLKIPKRTPAPAFTPLS